MEQIQAQRDYMRNVVTTDVARQFGREFQKPVNMDSYLVFSDGTDFSELTIDPETAGLWFIPTTLAGFEREFFSRSTRNHLKLDDREILWIAERRFGLPEADPVKFWVRMKATTKVFGDLIRDLEDTYDGEDTADLLRDALTSAVDYEAIKSATEFESRRQREIGMPDDEALGEYVRTAKQINRKHKAPGLVDRLFAQRLAEFLVHADRCLIQKYMEVREDLDTDILSAADIFWTLSQQYLDLLTTFRGIKKDLDYEAPPIETGSAMARMVHGSAAIRALSYDWRRATEPFKKAE